MRVALVFALAAGFGGMRQEGAEFAAWSAGPGHLSAEIYQRTDRVPADNLADTTSALLQCRASEEGDGFRCAQPILRLYRGGVGVA